MFLDDSVNDHDHRSQHYQLFYHRRQILEPCLADIPVDAGAAARPFVRENAFAAEEALGEKPRHFWVVHVIEDLAKPRAGKRREAAGEAGE